MDVWKSGRSLPWPLLKEMGGEMPQESVVYASISNNAFFYDSSMITGRKKILVINGKGH